MTLAAVWRDEQLVYAIADTRISQTHGVLTEHGPKLLPILVSCKQPGPSGLFDREVYRTSVGYAYAGATLPALSTQTLANTLFQTLAGAPGANPPGLDEVASAIGEIATRYMREIGALSGTAALFSAIVFGFCATANRFRAFTLTPVLSPSPLRTIVTEHDLYIDDALVVIGNRPDLLRARVQELRPNAPPVVVSDLPRRALQSLITEGADETVGGALQYGWASRAGFEPIAHAVPIVPPLDSGRNIALTVLGFDMLDFNAVGHYFFAMTGRV